MSMSNLIERVLIVGAHFDDAELGVAGTAAKLVSEGKKVYKLTLTDNVTESELMKIHVDYESSKKYSEEACKILGISEINNFQYERCNELIYTKDIMQKIESIILDLDIDTLFMHFNSDMNTDHIAASRLSLTAGRHCRNILQFQSNGYVLENVYYPTFFVDISNTVEKKIEALKCYKGDHNRFSRLFETCIEKNHIWGYSNKCDYAEGFNVIKLMYA